MNNYKTARLFIKEFKLKKNYEYSKLEIIAQKLGYKIFEFERNVTEDMEVLESLKASELALIKDCFSHHANNSSVICINALMPEAEKKIGVFHELLHIYKGHMTQNKTISITHEKEITDIHFITDFILKYQRKLLLALVAIIILTSLLTYNITKSHMSIPTINEADPNSKYVYITPDGDCYHAKNCSYGESYHRSIKVLFSEVEGKYLPCANCNPDKY